MPNVRICPKCKSTDTSPDLSLSSYTQGAIFNKWKCNECGFASIIFPEADSEEAKKHLKS